MGAKRSLETFIVKINDLFDLRQQKRGKSDASQTRVQRSSSSANGSAIQELIEMGLVVDTGQREWSERTQRFEIVWASTGSDRSLTENQPA